MHQRAGNCGDGLEAGIGAGANHGVDDDTLSVERAAQEANAQPAFDERLIIRPRSLEILGQ